MLTGRIIFALGAENMFVAKSAIISQWFKGKELSFAFGVGLSVARTGAYINGWALSQIAADYPGQPIRTVSYGFFLGFAVCVGAWVTAVLLAVIDKWADKVEGKEAVHLSEEEKFHFSDIKHFERPYWLIVLSCVLLYCVLFPFLSNVCNLMLIEKYGYSEQEAGSANFLPYLISAFLSAPLGFAIDKVGRRALVGMFSHLLNLYSNVFKSHDDSLNGRLHASERKW